MTEITLYSKADCPLCDEAHEALENLRREIPFRLRCVDITSDPTLFARFQFDIPVVAVAGSITMRGKVFLTLLREILTRWLTLGS